MLFAIAKIGSQYLKVNYLPTGSEVNDTEKSPTLLVRIVNIIDTNFNKSSN